MRILTVVAVKERLPTSLAFRARFNFPPRSLIIRSKLLILRTLARNSGSSPFSPPPSPPSLSSSSSSPSSAAAPCSVKYQIRKAKSCALGQPHSQSKPGARVKGSTRKRVPRPLPPLREMYLVSLIVWRGRSLVSERGGRHREKTKRWGKYLVGLLRGTKIGRRSFQLQTSLFVCFSDRILE